MSKKKFSLKRQSQELTLEKEDGQECNCELREMSAAQRDDYLQSLSVRMNRDASGQAAGISDFKGLHAELLTRCLYVEGKLVSAEEIQEWPASVLVDLYNIAQQLNKLAGDEAESPNG